MLNMHDVEIYRWVMYSVITNEHSLVYFARIVPPTGRGGEMGKPP